MAQRKLLLEALNKLENPASEITFDFDDEIIQAQVNFTSVENQEVAAKSFGNLRQKVQPQEESDPKYFGQKITRKSLNNHYNDKGTGEYV